MQYSNFSKNEINYLKNKNELEKTYSKNYIYQVRYSIKKKISNFIIKDMDLLLNFNNQRRERNKIKDDRLIEFLVLKIIKEYPNLILKILKLPEVKNYLCK